MARPVRLTAQALALSAVAALLALLVWDLVHEGNGGVAKQVQAGTIAVAPEFTLPRLDRAASLRFGSLRGKAVVVNFWASWCHPCKEEAGRLEAGWRKWRSRGVVFVGIDEEDFPGRARAFMRRYGITYPIVRDKDGHLVREYGLTGYPETFFVDRRGRVVDHKATPISTEELDAGIRKALAST
jgi:cytochrome c biogenesis protein CcmG, thiol:disulfide interchange protein DsbE